MNTKYVIVLDEDWYENKYRLNVLYNLFNFNIIIVYCSSVLTRWQ
jgi:hypothetical protein